MSTTTDLITAAVLFGPGLAGTAAIALSQRGARTESAVVQLVLAESAAARALTAQDEGGTPPPAREPAPDVAPVPAARLATVLPFPAAHDRRAA